MTDKHIEAARQFSEAVGFAHAPEDMDVTEYASRAEWLTAHGPSWDAPASPQWWADALATETAERQGWAGMRGEEMRLIARANNLRTLEAAADDLPLLQWPNVEPWPKGQPLPDNWREGLFMRKSDLREWAKTHAPHLLGSALLAEPKSAPAAEAARIAGPGTMRHSTKPSKSHFLAAQIRSAQAQAENASDAAARWESGAVFTALRAMALEGSVPFTGIVRTKGLEYTDAANCMQVFTPEALAAYLKRQRKKVMPADATRRQPTHAAAAIGEPENAA